MASKQGMTAVHGSLIFFVALSMILAVVAYLNFRDFKEQSASLKQEQAKASTASTAHRDSDAAVQTLKDLMGHNLPNTGDANSQAGDGTAAGAIKADVAKYAPGDLGQGTVHEVLERLSAALAQANTENAALLAEKEKLQAQIASLQGTYNASVAANETAREEAEKERDAAQQNKEETIAAKDKQIAGLEEQIRTTNLELAQEKDANARVVAEQKRQIDNLTQINDQLRQKQEEEQDLSFDQPDGLVDWVDHNSGLVWINLGEADGLKKRTSFSVYKKGHFGVARRDKGDIKGSVEVTRILGPHQAEARITKDILSDPIAPGDPIYSPLWGAGKQEHFAFVGIIDLDRDGRSDRARLHEIIQAAGGVIDSEINDQGVRVPADSRLNVHTKFLVVGEIPDPTKGKTQEEKDMFAAVGAQHLEMMREAREQGIKVVNLNDFLDYIGYQPKRRLWQEGDNTTWNLRQGARSTKTTPGWAPAATSTGRVSALYSGDKTPVQPSTGATSKIFNSTNAPQE